MRHTATKERRKLREEFVYRNAVFISDNFKVYFNDEVKLFVDNVVRKEIDYNHKTNSLDIWIFLKRTFKNIFQYQY